MKKLIGIGCAAVAVIAIVLIVVISGKVDESEKATAEKTVRAYYEAHEKTECDKVVQMLYPEVIQSDYFELMGTSLGEKIDEVALDLNSTWDEVNFVGGEYSWDVINVEHLDKLDKLKETANQDELGDMKTLRKQMDSWYKAYGLDADKISQAYAVEVEFSLDANGEVDKTTFVTYAYKYENEWYVLDMNSSKLISWIMSKL